MTPPRAPQVNCLFGHVPLTSESTVQNSESYLPLVRMQTVAGQIRCIASDVDGTLTDPRADAPAGALHPNVTNAIAALRERGLRFVIVTGRPAGFAWTLMQALGADAAIAENGGVIYFSSTPEVAWHIQFGNKDWTPFPVLRTQQNCGEQPSSHKLTSPLPTAEQHCSRQELAQAIFQALQDAGLVAHDCRPTHDNFFRLCDFTFPIDGIKTQNLQKIQKAVGAHGASFVYSSIHGHIMPCRQSKGEALSWVLNLWGLLPDACLTIGDSPNDESLFDRSVFPLSVGVANLVEHTGTMTERPRYLTTGCAGDGFLELLPVLQSTETLSHDPKRKFVPAASATGDQERLEQLALVIFFDGACVLCNAFADLLIGQLNKRGCTNPATQTLALSTLQGETARRLLPPHLQSPPYPSVLSCRVPVQALEPSKRGFSISAGQSLLQESVPPVRSLAVRSDAILQVLAELGPGWARFARIMSFLPRRVRDALYDLVARNRYLLFGRRDTCRLPGTNDRRWILD